jgi:hypothetical protein
MASLAVVGSFSRSEERIKADLVCPSSLLYFSTYGRWVVGQFRSMVCGEKQRLLEGYHSVTEEYSTAVKQLLELIRGLSKTDYDVLYQKTEALLQDVAAARIKLSVHVQEHGC